MCRKQQRSGLTQDHVIDAALDLATSARDLLGLPREAHLPSSDSDSFTTPFTPPTLSHSPTALEFLQRLQSGSAPFLIRDALADRPALQKWKDNDYLRTVMETREVKVACTPDGRADDIKTGPLGLDKWVFALPEERSIPFNEFLCSLEAKSDSREEILYLQSQDSNLVQGSSLDPLLSDLLFSNGNGNSSSSGPSSVPLSSSLSWASEAFASDPQATNLWIGTSASTSSMHRDHYENLFHVVRGRKIFTLFPPTEAYFLCEDEEDMFEIWRHVKCSSSVEKDWEPHKVEVISARWSWERQEDGMTPWIPIEPSQSIDSERNRRWGGERYRRGLKGLKVIVEEGMTLFLPAGWYHHVAQEVDKPPNGQRGLCIAINWWYESQAAFSDRWALLEFVKEVGKVSKAIDVDR